MAGDRQRAGTEKETAQSPSALSDLVCDQVVVGNLQKNPGLRSNP
jgi:hypothetical protein